jgi:hypothetical protein
MFVAALTVRPSRQRGLELVRMDNRNKDLALASVGGRVVLYAPADEARRGYFGTATIAEIRPDMTQRRFIFVVLKDVQAFMRCVALDDLSMPIESGAYRPDGTINFSYFSVSIRALTAEDAKAVRALNAMYGEGGSVGTPTRQYLEGQPARSIVRPRRSREETIRNIRLRWAVLECYGPSCAVCGDSDALPELGVYEVEVCHLRALERGGPDELTNAMPMCRKHHWAYDWGLFTLGRAGHIIASARMQPELHKRFNGRQMAAFPRAIEHWPKAEHLAFHRDYVFLG